LFIFVSRYIYISRYVQTYDKTEGKNIFISIPLILNCSQLDLSNPTHQGIFDYYKNTLKAKKDEYYETEWCCYVLRGYEGQEITIDDLSESQKFQMQYFGVSFEDIKADMRKFIIRNKVNEIQLFRPISKFEEGQCVQLTVYEEDDFLIPVEESKTETISGVEEKSEDKLPDGSSVMDLFKPKG